MENGTPKKPRRKYSAEEKLKLLQEAEQPGNSITEVARKYGISPSQLFHWRRHRDEASLEGLSAQERVVAESEYKQLRSKIRELQRLLGKKTQEVEILRDAIELAREKKLLSPSDLLKLRDIL